ncbi:MAG: hypothetical protein MZW92_69840 [Comamonadaceae bacterium]|nr:hypothetical protein [Comamonadaceae bacterium]
MARITLGAHDLAGRPSASTSPIEGGFVGMVDREHVRRVAARARGRARRRARAPAPSSASTRDADGIARSCTSAPDGRRRRGRAASVRARARRSAPTARAPAWRASAMPGAERMPYVFAYHEIVRAPDGGQRRLRRRRAATSYYRGELVARLLRLGLPARRHRQRRRRQRRQGLLAARRGRPTLRQASGLAGCETVRREGAPIPLKPLRALGQRPRRGAGRRRRRRGRAGLRRRHLLRDGRRPLRRRGGRRAAAPPATPRALASARKRFMKAHGRVFWMLGHHAALLVQQRQAARALRQHLPATATCSS